MKLLLPLILLLVGIGVGGGAGILFKSPSEAECPEEGECELEEIQSEKAAQEDNEDKAEPSYVAMKNQFVVPIVKNERISSLVVLSLSLETDSDETEKVFSKEPKLRDGFLTVLFDHAHAGGFDGAFTESGRLTLLRVALLESAQNVAGEIVSDILITDIVRQEVE